MEAKTKIKLLSLKPYRHLFPKAKAVDKTMKMGAGVSDTVDFIPQVVEKCGWQVKKFVDQELRGLPTYMACEKLWHFVKYHIKYEADKRGAEQVRSPRRLIHDGKGDCDCFTTFIDTCLHELGIKGIINRITEYEHKGYYQHIYPLVPVGKGKYIVMDCVVDYFNYEQPYTKKKDYRMDLQFLDGIDDTSNSSGTPALLGRENYIGELGKLLKKHAANKKGAAAKPKKAKQGGHKKFGAKLLKVANKLNKFNLATVLLRAGILASMKLNIGKVAGSLKWAYATKDLAQSKGMDMSKYGKLQTVLAKVEKIFYGAGGKPENLKKAILHGNGNKHHEVAGLLGLNGDTPLPELLGEVYQDEFEEGANLAGNGLGEPATAASLAAASSVITAIVAMIKKVGTLFPKKSKTASSGDSGGGDSGDGGNSGDGSAAQDPASPDNHIPPEDTNPAGNPETAPEESEPSPTPSDDGSESEPTPPADDTPAQDNGEDKSNLPAPVDNNTEVATTDESNTESTEPPDEGTNGILSGTVGMGIKAFFQKNSKWLIPTGIGVAALAGLIIYSSSHATTTKQTQLTLSGTGRKKKQKKKGGKKGRQGHKSIIALM